MNGFWSLASLIPPLITALLTGHALRPFSVTLSILITLTSFVFYYIIPVHIVAAAELAGWVGGVTYSAIFAVSALIFAAIFLVSRPWNPSRRGSTNTSNGRERPDQSNIFSSGFVATTVIICASSWLVFLINAIVSYSFGWDGLSYHLPLVVFWLQEQSLAIPSSGINWKFGYPANGEIGMMPFLGAGLQRLAFMPNFMAFAIAGLSVFLLTKKVSQTQTAATLSVALFAMLPIVQFQATSAYIDLFGASFILAGITFLAYRNDHGEHLAHQTWYRYAFILAGLSWGIAVGSKHVFYAYGAFCFLGALAIAWTERLRHGISASYLAGVLGLSILLPSIFWLVRAAYATGNPFHPIEISILGLEIFPGWPVGRLVSHSAQDQFILPSGLSWLSYPWVEFKETGYAFGIGSGVGAAWATFTPVGLLFALVLAVMRFHQKQGRACAILLIVLITMVAVWSLGLRRLPRFGLPFLAIACVLTAPLFDYFVRNRRKSLRVLVLMSFGTSAILSTFVPMHEILGRIRANEFTRAGIFEMPSIIDELPKGSVVWNAGTEETMNFALAGLKLENRVIRRRWPGIKSAQEFIRKHKINYVVEWSPFCCGELEALGAKILFDAKVGPTHHWRVWALLAGDTLERR